MSKVDDVIAVASTELGKPYTYGAEGPNTFDCSGLMQYIFAQVGITLPRTAAQQQNATTAVATPLPGDLVFWGKPAYHVALYIGNNKIIAAPHTGSVVQIENVWGQPSGYGRVKGLGAAIAPVLAVTTAAVSTVGSVTSTATSWLGSARYIVLEAVAVGLGVALVGFGLWRAEAPFRKKLTKTVGEIL